MTSQYLDKPLRTLNQARADVPDHFVPPQAEISFIQDDIGRLLDGGHKDAVKDQIYDWLANELNIRDDADSRAECTTWKLNQGKGAK